jgi:hypothetical protein
VRESGLFRAEGVLVTLSVVRAVEEIDFRNSPGVSDWTRFSSSALESPDMTPSFDRVS